MGIEEEIAKLRAELDVCSSAEQKANISGRLKELLTERIKLRIGEVHKNLARLRAMGQSRGKGVDFQRSLLQTLKLASKLLDEKETVAEAISDIDAMIRRARSQRKVLEIALDIESQAKLTELKNKLKNLEEARGILAL